jgi:hypothetical protein
MKIRVVLSSAEGIMDADESANISEKQAPESLITVGPHLVVAVLPGAKLVQTQSPLILRKPITGAAACSATHNPSANAPKPNLIAGFIDDALGFMVSL